MVNKPKVIGTRWETDVVRYLREHGYKEAERRALAGGVDMGDIVNAGPFVWECKATKSIDLAGGLDETKAETINADAAFGFLIVKRRRKSTGEAYAVMTLEQLCHLLAHIPTT